MVFSNISEFSVGNGDNFDLDPEVVMVDLDNDGINDSIARGFDTDGDGRFDSWLIESDFDGDGAIDVTSAMTAFDSDGNGIEDSWLVEADLDGDLIVDESTVVANEDFTNADTWMSDEVDVNTSSQGTPLDFDGDGINESIYRELDTDNDGQIDTTVTEADFNGDGLVDAAMIQADLNGDLIIDQSSYVEMTDSNGDGQHDTWAIETDLNGDGIADESMRVADTNLDGVADTLLAANAVASNSNVGNSSPQSIDVNGDGINESIYQELDTDNNGQIDTVVIEADIDGDRITDVAMIQSDFDGDGLVDRAEMVEALDPDGDGVQDTWKVQRDLDGDGVIDEAIALADTDGDGIADAELASDDMAVDNPDIVGNPESDMANWHQQTKNDTCAVVCQEFILDEMTGRDFAEAELTQQAIDNGWYIPGGGTPTESIGKLLEANGIEIEQEYNCSLDDIHQKLADGENVIVAIDGHETWYPGGLDSDRILAEVSGIPEQGVNHAVQVIGIDRSDPDNPVVILNDPGIPDGQGVRVDADDFMDAWADSDNFMVATVS